MLLRCYLLHITIIILRNFLCLVYLSLFLGLVLFKSYLCDPLFIFSTIFIIINHIISLRQTHLFFTNFFSHHLWMITWIKKVNNFQTAKVQPQGVAQFLLDFFANFRLVLLIKVLLIKKCVFKIRNKTFAVNCFSRCNFLSAQRTKLNNQKVKNDNGT